MNPFGIIAEAVWLLRAAKRAAVTMARLNDCEPW